MVTSTQPVLSGVERREPRGVVERRHRAEDRLVLGAVQAEDLLGDEQPLELNSRLLSITPSAWFQIASRRPSQL